MAIEKRVTVDDQDMLHKLFGTLDQNIKVIMDTFPVNIASRDNDIVIIGDHPDDVELVETLMVSLMETIKTGNFIE